MSRPNDIGDTLPRFMQILRQFWPFIRQHKGKLALSFLALFMEVGFRLLEPWALAIVIDHVLVSAPNDRDILPIIDRFEFTTTGLLYFAAILLVVVTTLRAFAAYLSTIGFAIVGNRVLTDVRGKLYDHLQRLSLGYHGKARSGDLTVRVVGDIGMLKEITVTAIMPFIGNIFILLGMLGVMFYFNSQLALIALVTLPLFFLASMRWSKSITSVSRNQRKREGAMASTASESIGGIKIVQALGLERVFSDNFAEQNGESMTAGVKAKKMMTRLERTADILIAISTALVLFFGARLVLTGGLSPGELIVFLTYLKNAFKPVRDFAKYTGRIAKATAAGERVVEVLQQEPEISDRPGAIPAPALRGIVEFEGLTFGYEPEQPVLRGIDFRIEPGRRVALVGPSGNGKSTLANLLLRLYDPDSGSVRIDGRDIRDYELESLRDQISVVMQDSLLFAASVRENIAHGVSHADGRVLTEEEIIAAAKLANAHEFIERMPDGYETVLSERGSSLSGGQRQRIAIARAAVRRSPILLLDEPTTGLDEQNEREVTEALERLAEGRTTFMITHDLALAARSDELMYVENGRIAERGTHEELLRAGGRYAALHRLQATTGDGAAEIGEARRAFTRR